MWEKEIWGNTVENWGIFLLIIAGTLIVSKLLSLFNQKVLKKITRKTKTHLDDIIFDAVEAPILFGILLGGIWFAFHGLNTSPGFDSMIDKAYKILMVMNVTWLFARLVNSFIEAYLSKQANKSAKIQKHANRMMPVVRRTVLTIVWIIGLVTALGNVGVDLTAILGAMGIGGIAFALAAQDTVKNIIGAFVILTDRPFGIGDVIRIDGFEGTIVDVGVRSTKMRNYDKRIITFPNYKISDASIVNISAEPMRRVVMKLGLTYDTTPEKMSEAMLILKNIPSKVDFVSPKDLAANFTDFGDSAMIITFTYYIEKRGDIQSTTSAVNLEILTEFNKAGLSFAFPSQTLYIEKE